MEVRGQLQVSVLSFLRVGLGDLIQVVRPVSKCLVLNHLPKPELKKKNNIACAMCADLRDHWMVLPPL